mgnify:CR=1 FL=1
MNDKEVLEALYATVEIQKRVHTLATFLIKELTRFLKK